MKNVIRKYFIIIAIILFSMIAFDKRIGEKLLGQMINSLGENQRIEVIDKKKNTEIEYKIQLYELNQ